MAHNKLHKRKGANSDGVAKFLITEMVVLYILLGACLCGFFYVLVKLILSFHSGITIALPA
jgi:hypothetical protein